MPWSSMYEPILSATSRSKPRRRMDRTATVTSWPMPARKPAHSNEMYDAPTHRVLPGLFSSAKISSEEMASSPPSHSRGVGRPPTAMMKREAVISETRPFLSVTSRVWASLNLPSLFRYETPFSRRLTRYLKLRERMWFCTFSRMLTQACLVSMPVEADSTPVGTGPMPKAAASAWMDSLIMAALCINFLGIHPTLTQVPPRPHLVPAGLGLTKSSTATLAPNAEASLEAASPPDPPPITTRS
mmetsp:Transcript_25332/g.59287  ORF Transcript_25332/g.59287 Transcript_25332/m.59287 type:complete len:243 (+) Transcript_25332:856-1584(+)